MGFADFGLRGIRGEFFKTLKTAEAGTWANKLGMNITSDQEVETYRWLGATSQLREWNGGRLERAIRDEIYTITNLKFENTMAIMLDDIRRDKTGQILTRVGEMAVRAVTHWEKLLTDLIIANTACYDGLSFFNTAHVSGASGAQNNALTKAQIAAAQVAVPGSPTAVELADVFIQAAAYLYTYVDDVGEPVNQNANNFAIMLPTSMLANAQTAVKANFLTAGVTNVAVNSEWNFQIIPNPRLATTSKLYIFRVDGEMKPLIMQSEQGITDQFAGPGSDEEFHNDRWLYGIKTLRNAGYGYWNHAASIQLAV